MKVRYNMNKIQEKKVKNIIAELEIIASECSGIITDMKVEEIDKPNCTKFVCVAGFITGPDGTSLNENGEYIFKSFTIFVGLRGGLTYVKYNRKRNTVRITSAKCAVDTLD
jgi:hypothetical protein